MVGDICLTGRDTKRTNGRQCTSSANASRRVASVSTGLTVSTGRGRVKKLDKLENMVKKKLEKSEDEVPLPGGTGDMGLLDVLRGSMADGAHKRAVMDLRGKEH